ncbi:ABC transporter ATP-binding protein [Chloroflexota bacterium]
MSDLAIRVQNISKKYRIGLRKRQDLTLRKRLGDMFLSPFDYLRTSFRRASKDEILWALKDVSFEVKQGEVLGIIGRNGAGKSTLLKVLSRITEPTSGTAEIYGRVGSLLEVGTGFHPELTGRENIYMNGAILGMRKAEIDLKFDEIVDFAGVEKFIDTPVKRYSSGMYVRLAFAVAAHLEPEILLVDEVLAVGDAEFQKKCLGKMEDVASEGRTVMFVSHNMQSILNLCPSTYVLDTGQIAFSGRSEDAVQFYLQSFSDQRKSLDPHVIYKASPELTNSEIAKITLVEVLDNSHNPKPFTYTWDNLIIRLHYVSQQTFDNGSFVLDFYDYKQQRLIVLDSGMQIPIQEGKHYVDCYIPLLPLAAGEYYIGGGLGISRTEFIEYSANLGNFRVQGKDVFNLGRPPEIKRMLFALEHHWQK